MTNLRTLDISGSYVKDINIDAFGDLNPPDFHLDYDAEPIFNLQECCYLLNQHENTKKRISIIKNYIKSTPEKHKYLCLADIGLNRIPETVCILKKFRVIGC